MKQKERKRKTILSFLRYSAHRPSRTIMSFRRSFSAAESTPSLSSSTERFPSSRKRSLRAPTAIPSLGHDILCMIFAFLDIFDLVRCSAVCKFWNSIINRSELLQELYYKHHCDAMSIPSTSKPIDKQLSVLIEELAMKRHRLSFQEGPIHVSQWKGHLIGVNQCRMRMGLVLTGVGDKVMRLWSLDSYKCIEEYAIADMAPLVDFDFDESKVVGLCGTQLCIWRKGGRRSIFPSREGTFAKGLCMRYSDPEAVIGCEDGTARVFDMYSRKCTRIIRMHPASINCLCLSDDQLIISGSSLGSVTISGSSSGQSISTLRSADRTGIKAVCFNPSSQLVFAGTSVGYTCCWDLRTMRSLWETRVSPNVIYSLQHLQNDISTLIVGGIDGILRAMDQNTGQIISGCVMGSEVLSTSRGSHVAIETRKGTRLAQGMSIDSIPRSVRPPITCLAVGMKKVVTAHNTKYIKLWKFG